MWLVSLSAFISILFLYASAPLALAVLVAGQSVSVALMMSVYSKSSWFAFLFLIIFLSGLMVIFTYVSSLASNEFLPALLPVALISFVTTLIASAYFFFVYAYPKQTVSFNSTLSFSLTANPIEAIYKMYGTETFILSMIMITYLLIALIVVMKSASYYTGPLRSFT